MSRTAKTALAFALLCLAAAALLPAAAMAAKPGWSLTLTPMPAALTPGKSGEYLAVATNVGGAVTTAQTTLEMTVPEGLEIKKVEAVNIDPASKEGPVCKAPVGQTITCKTEEPVHPGRWLLLQVNVAIPASANEGSFATTASVSGGGAGHAALLTVPTPVQSEVVPFDFLPGFVAPATSDEGTSETLAGKHPFQQTISFGFPTKNPGDGLTNDGHPRDVYINLPRGMSGNPGATPVLCTEAQLISEESCPDEAQVGIADVTTLLGEAGNNVILSSPLYSMVPPPGSPAEFATNVAFAGIYLHALGGVRAESDYGIQVATRDALAFGQQPIFNVQAQVWGDPSAKAHDTIRGVCRDTHGENSCPVPEQSTAFLTMPLDCPANPLSYKVFADSWEKPSPPFEERQAAYASADSEGNPALLQGCGELDYEPAIAARPTTNASDSPSGLDATLEQPQQTDLEHRYTAGLKDLVMHLPAGLAVNPSRAGGLGSCSEAEIGFKGKDAEGPHFSKSPQSCPDAAKIGTAEVISPLLVARNEKHEVEKDPEGTPVLEPLHGSLYIAKPFQNPFNSLIATYLAIEDRKTGITVKLAGEGSLDPQSGQISISFEETPELPLQEARVHLFGGARGALTTPPTCGPHTTTSELTPWSAPEGKDAFPEDAFELTATPLGGPCPATEAGMPHAPVLSAGTLLASAAKYSPLLFELSRPDGSQRWAKLEAALPSGLSAKLAGVGQCSETDIARARSREVPEQGAAEQADPSCPLSSEIGTVVAAAGSGPTPYYTQGHAYLAGPYKGAPLSVVAIVPAVAGPFDLGAVVIQNALYLDPTTAKARIVSDPLPTILDGVPVDLRSVSVRVDRADFALNPTSCAQKSFGGAITSTLGQIAPLFARFQVGGCKSLPYKPKFSARLFGPIHRGGHPRFKAVFTAKPGEANTAALSFTLPRSEFIDQAHFRTICTRVQFAAGTCPAGSVYGFVKAKTPLLDYTLEGPIYLRSSSHKLPDAVAALHGPPSQPIEFDAVARVDSVNGGLRFRVEEVPDVPLSKVIITAQGAKKGLFQNSTNICKGAHRATLKLSAQNGKVQESEPQLRAQCPKKGKGSKGGGKRR